MIHREESVEDGVFTDGGGAGDVEHADDIAQRMGPNADIVEFGAGSLRKVRILLDALRQPHRYLPIDISGEHLAAASATLRHAYPSLEVTPITADYTRRLLLPAPTNEANRCVGAENGAPSDPDPVAPPLNRLTIAPARCHPRGINDSGS